MQIAVSNQTPLEFSSGALILPIFSGEKLSDSLLQIDNSLDGLLSDLIENDGFKAKSGEHRLIYTTGGQAKRLILLGLGDKAKFSTQSLRKAAAKSVKAVKTLKKTEFAFVLPDLIDDEALAVSEGLILGAHSFDDFKSGEKFEFQTATLLTAKGEAAESGAARAALTSEANLRARHLVNLPSNLKSPASLARYAEEIGEANGLKVTVWDEDKILEERMGALFGVGMGSDNKPRFIVIEYTPEGTENDAPIALVGKGMTFDSGGYSIKPAASMEDMKDDMAGAALVLGVMSVVKPLGIKKRILGVIASAENMISSNAQRPGDIVTARNGKTIEVLNTDAEGRLILADALSWTCEQNPSQIIDFATLTGAIVIALGHEGAGLFSNDDELSGVLAESGIATNEKVWRFPLWEDYDESMKGTVSDLKNISGERGAGSIVAAIFLREFVAENIPWAHLDIAGVSLMRTEKHLTQRGATGFGVRLILDYLSR